MSETLLQYLWLLQYQLATPSTSLEHSFRFAPLIRHIIDGISYH